MSGCLRIGDNQRSKETGVDKPLGPSCIHAVHGDFASEVWYKHGHRPHVVFTVAVRSREIAGKRFHFMEYEGTLGKVLASIKWAVVRQWSPLMQRSPVVDLGRSDRSVWI